MFIVRRRDAGRIQKTINGNGNQRRGHCIFDDRPEKVKLSSGGLPAVWPIGWVEVDTTSAAEAQDSTPMVLLVDEKSIELCPYDTSKYARIEKNCLAVLIKSGDAG